MDPDLMQAVSYFVHETGIMSCLSIACGDDDRTIYASGGVINAQGDAVTEESIFDLASLTKLMTSLMVYRLRDEGLIDLTRPVVDYEPRFSALQGVTVEEVLGFQVALITPERVDTQVSRERGLDMLFRIEARPNAGRRAYSDMHSMVLKYVLENAGGMPYMKLLSKYMLDPLNMHVTCSVPTEQRHLAVSCDREHRIEPDRWLLRTGITPGTPHDPKARLLNREGDDCPGHAGLFGTVQDMVRLCRGVLDGRVVSRESLRDMAQNRTGRQLEDGSYTQYLGAQCYVKHPIQRYSEVPVFMGDQTLAVSGFTGHHLSIDPDRRLFIVALGNRVLDRLTVLVPPQGKSLTDYGLSEDGRGSLLWKDGVKIMSSVQYVYLRDEHLHRHIRAALDL
ncbi:MAG: beta-lactamase family protein [Clostridia bacterium]|nr:beta-lactamase family protein [Clostridia bacterium]